MKIEMEAHMAGHHPYVTFLKYYPTRFVVAEEYVMNRQFVYSFKAGNIPSSVITLFANSLRNYVGGNNPLNYWVCAIPASTVLGTIQRFQGFCQQVSAQAGVNNGFALLQPTGNRNQVHMGESRDYSQVVDSLQFGDFSGKRVFLCDDVATTGKSFRLIADRLMELGAVEVLGMMLAKTHWLEEEIAF